MLFQAKSRDASGDLGCKASESAPAASTACSDPTDFSIPGGRNGTCLGDGVIETWDLLGVMYDMERVPAWRFDGFGEPNLRHTNIASNPLKAHMESPKLAVQDARPM